MNAEICKERNFFTSHLQNQDFFFSFCAASEMKGTKYWVNTEVLLSAFLTKDYF